MLRDRKRKWRNERSQGVLARLLSDSRGNALVILAAAMIPLAGMIGSGLDLSRTYVARSKLQAACDAAALAARRAMADRQLDQAAIDEGVRFFNFNFPPGTMRAPPVDLDITADETDLSVVNVSASTNIPTSVMRLFGFESLPISVECSADQDYVNNDVMLVLDVTGSMNCRAGTSCTAATTEQSNSRLSRMRAATAALYRALEGATGVRTRYGFVSYSMTVNVGHDLQRAWLREPSRYWQREQETYCSRYWNNSSCRTWSTRTNWVYNQVPHSSSWFDNDWDGCVEERSTISQNHQSEIRISTDVSQADIDSVSTTDPRLQWQPYDPDATQNPNTGTTPRFCPARAARLAEYGSEDDFQDQVDASLARVGGSTNHDLGMMWGMRFLSSTGMFAADNPEMVGEVRVDRHIIFMTDGLIQAPQETYYSSYGVRAAETRLIGSGSQDERHRQRFWNACTRARNMGMTVWVIALDVQAPETVRPCASGDERFFISDGTDLELVFTQIGRGIGRLRMTR